MAQQRSHEVNNYYHQEKEEKMDDAPEGTTSDDYGTEAMAAMGTVESFFNPSLLLPKHHLNKMESLEPVTSSTATISNAHDPATFLSCVDEEKEGDNSD
eukprot:1204486-Ditylum_brightwellii.AAC.1